VELGLDNALLLTLFDLIVLAQLKQFGPSQKSLLTFFGLQSHPMIQVMGLYLLGEQDLVF
jgi:hypothetical protein